METPQEKFAEYIKELKTLESITDFYGYEKKFSEIHTQFGKAMLEMQIEQQQPPVKNKEYKKKFKPNLEK